MYLILQWFSWFKDNLGGGDVLKKFYKGWLHPEVQPLTFMDRKDTLFVYVLLPNGTPFTYLVYDFSSLLTAVKALSLKY